MNEETWMYDVTQPRRVVKPQSLLSRVLQQDESELARAQENIETMLLDWPQGLGKKGENYE